MYYHFHSNVHLIFPCIFSHLFVRLPNNFILNVFMNIFMIEIIDLLLKLFDIIIDFRSFCELM